MLKKLFKKTREQEDLQIYAPLTGEIIALEEVPDPVFNQKMMGEGIAIIPSEGKLFSPVKGKITHISETKHAIGLEAIDGTEILIHIGLETVKLKGKGFSINVTIGDNVSVGDPLIDFDLEYIKNNTSDSITPIIITNSNLNEETYIMTHVKKAIAAETVIITKSKKS